MVTLHCHDCLFRLHMGVGDSLCMSGDALNQGFSFFRFRAYMYPSKVHERLRLFQVACKGSIKASYRLGMMTI